MPGQTTPPETLQELIASGNARIHEDVAAAAANLEGVRKRDNENRIIRKLETIERNQQEALIQLRHTRGREAIEKKYLTTITSARAQFLADADTNKYDRAINKAVAVRDTEINNIGNPPQQPRRR